MRKPPTSATAAIVGLTGLAFLAGIIVGPFADVTALLGFIPGRVTGAITVVNAVPAWLTPLTATLVHAGWMHLGFNMLMLWWCGRQVEQAIGPWLLLALYCVGAYAAAAVQALIGPVDAVTVGASGAISAVVATYALIFSEQKVASLGPISSYTVRVAWLAAAWIGLQALIGFGFGSGGQPVAIGAHIGGFLAGLLLARPLLRWRYRRA